MDTRQTAYCANEVQPMYTYNLHYITGSVMKTGAELKREWRTWTIW